MSSDLPSPPPPPPPGGSWPQGPPARHPVPLDSPLRTSPLTIALEAIGLAFFGLTIAANWLAGADLTDVPGLVVGFVITLQRTVGWWFRTYTVTQTSITIDEGILQKRHRVVPFSRIQQVEHRQQLTARLFGLVAVHVETAADAGTTAITLRSLDLPTAEALREHLLAEQRRVRAGQSAPLRAAGEYELRHAPVHDPLLRVSPGELVLAGMTDRAVVFFAALTLLPSALIAGTVDGPAALLVFVAIEVGVSIAIAVFGAVGSVLSGWGFELTATDDDLHVTHGLLDRRQHTMPRHRLQHVRVMDNPVRRALGFTSVELFSAATPGRGDQQRTAISIPFVRRHSLGDVLVASMGSERFRPPRLVPRSAIARRRAVVRRTALTTAVTAVAVVALLPAGLVLAPLALLGIVWGRTAHRRAGSALEGDVLVVASGVLVHHLELVPTERVQSRHTTSSPFQRRVGLVTLRLDVAGARRRLDAPGLNDLAADVADAVRRTVPARPRARVF